MLILMMMVMIVILMCTKKVLIGFCLPQGMEKSLIMGNNLPSSSSLSLSPLSMRRRKLLNSLKKGQCVIMTQGYADHGAGLLLRIQLIIDIVLVEMIFIDDIFLS